MGFITQRALSGSALRVLAFFPCDTYLPPPKAQCFPLHFSPAKQALGICSGKLASPEWLMAENQASFVAPPGRSCCPLAILLPLSPWPQPPTGSLALTGCVALSSQGPWLSRTQRQPVPAWLQLEAEERKLETSLGHYDECQPQRPAHTMGLSLRFTDAGVRRHG